jgi:hypothetical protein
LLGPGNIDIAELLVRMQFAIYCSTSELHMTPKSENEILSKASDGSVEDEEEPEVIVESEALDVTIQNDDETSVDEEDTEKAVENEELTILSNEDPNEDAENNKRNVHDVTSEETHECMKWSDLIEQEEKRKVIFVAFPPLQLLVSFKF